MKSAWKAVVVILVNYDSVNQLRFRVNANMIVCAFDILLEWIVFFSAVCFME